MYFVPMSSRDQAWLEPRGKIRKYVEMVIGVYARTTLYIGLLEDDM